MSYDNVLVNKGEAYGVITLNRPKANALSLGLVLDIRAALEELEQDASVRCVLITGSGRFFSAGADVPTIQSMLADPFVEGGLLSEGVKTMNAVEACTKPVVAVVNGMALGGGCELTLACDLRIAADSAVFGQPEIKLGIIPGWGGTFRLPRLIGQARATDLLLTGRTFTAPEALEMGFVSTVVPAEQLMDTAKALAADLAKLPASAVRATLSALSARAYDTSQGVAVEGDAFLAVSKSPDALEGITAFLEKREPRFSHQ
ncbi:MAG TPA: enoyl-CoA hydratase/isomerase family protein [Candidatus Hydrogenedentes bacterium]|nr:enoyl-CoA hydratase/isomerase family protein [Candidatus Hydrogenedentota bacterium]HPG68513.1 enoyl-CoA hydratase/isomerase family protein [Candidatus Hydrogenedentota bacterium]